MMMISQSLILSVAVVLVSFGIHPVKAEASHAEGFVFLDSNGNGMMDRGEPGIAGIPVSNQVDIVKTDANGKWSLPTTDDTIFFVIKPAGYDTPVNEHNLPQFYYVHKPAGSPDFKYPGVKPTGPLPKSINFPLTQVTEPSEFDAIFFGDPQPRTITEVEYIGHDVVEELIGSTAEFGVTLGDIVFDDLDLFEDLNGTIGHIGIPWFNVIGNHDINFEAANDADSDETFTRVYGPSYYSFNYGPVHFIVLDNVMWGGAKPQGTGSYSGGLGSRQLKFIKNNLKLVSKDKLLVLLMHIPLMNTVDRQELYKLIDDRPYTFSISGHTHWQAHLKLGKEDGWNGPKPHHHFVCVTVSGSWWSGLPDEYGIPHTTMRDGVPNGYSIITFSENKADVGFKAARRPASWQMSIHAPDLIQKGQGSFPVTVNVFNGWEDSKVQVRLNDNGPWTTLPFSRETRDPFLTEEQSREPEKFDEPFKPISAPVQTYHIWKSSLNAPTSPGIHKISVRATDVNGRSHKASRIIRVE